MSDSMTQFRLYAQTWRKPYVPVFQPFERRPQDVMEELREVDPDAHALLSEHIVLPERKSDA
jgi:hypothetical protein